MDHHANIGEAIRLLEQASDLVAQPDMTGDFNRLIREARDTLEPSRTANADAVHAWVRLDGAAPLAGPGVGADPNYDRVSRDMAQERVEDALGHLRAARKELEAPSES